MISEAVLLRVLRRKEKDIYKQFRDCDNIDRCSHDYDRRIRRMRRTVGKKFDEETKRRMDSILLELERKRPFTNFSPNRAPYDLQLRRVEISEHAAWDKLVKWAESRYPAHLCLWLSSYEPFDGEEPPMHVRKRWLEKFMQLFLEELKEEGIGMNGSFSHLDLLLTLTTFCDVLGCTA